MKIFYFTIFSLSLLSAACNNKLKVDKSGFNLNEPFAIKVNETAKLNNGNLELTLTGIPEDSRCPEDANCIWEGQVRLFFSAAVPTNKKSIEFKIEKSKVGQVSQGFENYTILVQDVQPMTRSGVKVGLEDYVVTLNVSAK